MIILLTIVSILLFAILWLVVGLMCIADEPGLLEWLDTFEYSHSLILVALWPYIIHKWKRAEPPTLLINTALWTRDKLAKWTKAARDDRMEM
jgi:hypothetical protein